MNGLAITDSITEFLTLFLKATNSNQWSVMKSVYGVGDLTLKQTVRISDKTYNSGYYLPNPGSFSSLSLFATWLGPGPGGGTLANGGPGVLKSRLLADDPPDGIYIVVLAEEESLKDDSGHVIMTSKVGDCGYHSFAHMNTGTGQGLQTYMWLMVQIPSTLSSGAGNCFMRSQSALGYSSTYGSNSTTKRNKIINDLAHELYEIASDPFPGYGYSTATGTTEIGDLCANVFPNTSTAVSNKPYSSATFNANTQLANSAWSNA